ncbi:MAG: LuxR family transcriptional regulator [Dehalococcoidia bacterium]
MRVVVVDDHDLFRQGVCSLLSAHGIDVVGEATDGLEGVVKAEALRPDVVLMDVRMPGMGGLEATRMLKARAREIRIVVLTISEDDEDLFEAVKCGADGYLLKDLHSDDFFRLLEGVLRGQPAVTPTLAAKILREFSRTHPHIAPSGDELTQREHQVVDALANGAPNKEIAHALGIAESTAKYHIANVLAKLHLHNRGEVIAYATGRPRPNDGLTQREREILQALAGGASNRELADELCITESTAKYHVSTIMAKLHLRGRGEVIAYANRHGFSTGSLLPGGAGLPGASRPDGNRSDGPPEGEPDPPIRRSVH